MLMEDLAAHMEVVDEAGEAGVLGREAEAWLKGSLATHTYALGTNTETHSYVSYVCMCIYIFTYIMYMYTRTCTVRHTCIEGFMQVLHRRSLGQTHPCIHACMQGCIHVPSQFLRAPALPMQRLP